MKTLSDITATLREVQPQLFTKYGIEQLAIFGSYSRSDQNINSDLDILVEFNQPIGIEFIDLAEELEIILNIRVDLVSKHGIKSKYFKVIESELKYV